MIHVDIETCGFHGFAVLLQYAVDNGDIVLHEVWRKPIGETVELLEWLADQELCFFNAAFDWFHVYKMWTTFSLLMEKVGPDFYPEDDIKLVAEYEEKARDYPFCLKPRAVIDLMLHARKGPYQKLMRRKPIIVRRVPTVLAESVRNKLEQEIRFDDVFFSNRAKPNSERWVIKDVKNNPSFKDISLEFNPSTRLKVLAQYALGVEENAILKFTNIAVDKKWNPKELGYAPYAKAVGKGAWPDVIEHHISHWAFNSLARQYAGDDINYTRGLYHFFKEPVCNDTDSILACMVAVVRWRGFAVDIDKLRTKYFELKKKVEGVPTAPSAVKRWLEEVMTPTQAIAISSGTDKDTLKAIAEWTTNPQASERASLIIGARESNHKLDIIKKILLAGRFHVSLKVIGTLSSRMSGDDNLNAQGIENDPEIRECFTLAQDGYILSGGDFVSFEVCIAEAVYNDDNLRQDILSGKKFHALLAAELYPELTYDDIMKKENKEKYNNGKTAAFRLIYGGGWEGMVEPLGVKEEVAEKAYNNFLRKYPGIQRYKDEINDLFCSMKQPNGIGTAVIWKEPHEYVESKLGFRRYFTLENYISKKFFEIAQAPSKAWKYIKAKVTRRDRIQTACGATQTALFAAAFNLQQRNLRAAANHVIQCTGSQITKEVQRAVWNLQPYGVATWMVQPMNIHDELQCPCHPSVVDKLETTVKETVNDFKSIVPLMSIDWKRQMDSWAGK
jgi:hypothetical protein